MNATNDTTQANALNDWQKIEVFLEQNPQFSEPQLRGLLLKRKSNGFDKVVKKIGKPLYLSATRFQAWIEGIA